LVPARPLTYSLIQPTDRPLGQAAKLFADALENELAQTREEWAQTLGRRGVRLSEEMNHPVHLARSGNAL
jgi:hypothetical protein